MAFAVLARASCGSPPGRAGAVADSAVRRSPHAVVDEYAVADPGAGMDLNAGEGTTDLAEAAGGQFQGRQVQRRWLILCS